MKTRFRVERFLPFRLARLAAEVSERLSRVYALEFDLDVTQWRIVANLASMGHATAQEICVRTLTHKSTVSRAVQQLEDRGLLERAPHRNDGRSFELRLSEKGETLFDTLRPLVLRFERKLLEGLAPEDRAAVERGLSALEIQLARLDAMRDDGQRV